MGEHIWTTLVGIMLGVCRTPLPDILGAVEVESDVADVSNGAEGSAPAGNTGSDISYLVR
jgi:hypothetical protein